MAIELTSTSFRDGEPIPKDHTADGKNVPPPLRWSDPPSGTQSFSFICEDPDAPRGTFTHWVLFNVLAELRELSEHAPQDVVQGGAVQGKNDFGKVGYGGPSPPPGKPHRYFFHLFALDTRLDLPPGATREQLLARMQDHVLGHGELMGTYGRDGS